jgi:hypothetical protein
MVARPIHRFGTADRLFHGAEAAGPREGAAALFGVAGEPSRALRDASWSLPPAAGLSDLGDIAEPTAAPAAALAIRARAARPVLCGCSAATAAAMLGAVLEGCGGDAAMVLVSARLDPVLPAAAQLAIGAHDLLPARDVARWSASGGVVVTADAVEAEGAIPVATALARLGRRRGVVLLDMGVIDTGYAAGAEGLNVGGLTPAGFIAVLAALRQGLGVEGLAICGLAPERDPRGHSERLAAQAVAALASA